MNVNGGGEADQASSKQTGDWQTSPIIGVVVAVVAVCSIIVAPMAALAHHQSQRPTQVQQDGE